MMHQDTLKPAAIQFTLEHLQESARQSGYFLPAFFMCIFISTYYLEVLLVEPIGHCFIYYF